MLSSINEHLGRYPYVISDDDHLKRMLQREVENCAVEINISLLANDCDNSSPV